MNKASLNILRFGMTGAIAGFTAASAYYPHLGWIRIVIAVLGTVAVHLIPANGQTLDQ